MPLPDSWMDVHTNLHVDTGVWRLLHHLDCRVDFHSNLHVDTEVSNHWPFLHHLGSSATMVAQGVAVEQLEVDDEVACCSELPGKPKIRCVFLSKEVPWLERIVKPSIDPKCYQ